MKSNQFICESTHISVIKKIMTGGVFLQSTLLLFLWEKMVYTICGGETLMKKKKTTMLYMQLFKLHLIHVFSQKNLANVKKWPKNGHFRTKNHVL